MVSIIKEKLMQIEEAEHIKIIHAVESGSRAWGFASVDSDYDVRFIYIREPEFYYKLEKTRDVIEWELGEIWDINGWDMTKALRLLYRSNPTLFEWCNSPIVYHTTPMFDQLKQLINEYFSCKSGLYHYLSTAQSNYREYLKTDEVRLKKYFYVVRPILACKWIIDRKTPPPMLFSELVKTQLDADMKPIISELLDKKMKTAEMERGKRIDPLNHYIEASIEELKGRILSMEEENSRSWKPLDQLFLRFIALQK